MQTILETPNGKRVPVKDWLKWLALDQQVKAGKAYYLIREEKLEIIKQEK